jgi:hypothetical protein
LARSALPLTCALIFSRGSVTDIARIHESRFGRTFSEENFDAEEVPPFLAPEGGSGFAEARLTLP